jgi:hypothetical protein
MSNLLGTYKYNLYDEDVSFLEQIAAAKGRFGNKPDKTLLWQWRLHRLRA